MKLAARSARHALIDSALCLLLACAATACFLPPWVADTVSSVTRIVATGLVLLLALSLHWVFLGIAVHRLGRSLRGWLALAVLLFPVGGAAALILLGWLQAEHAASPAPAPAP